MGGEISPASVPSRASTLALLSVPLLGTPVLTLAVVTLQWRWVLPAAQCLTFYPVLLYCLWHGWRKRAIFLGLIWALALTVTLISVTVVLSDAASATVLSGVAYKNEMYEWIRTGIGIESQPAQFIPRHLITIVLFVITSLLTGSLVSLLLGAVMMNYMSFYVGSLVRDSTALLPPLLLGWHIWSILRVASFVILGVVLAEPLWAKLRGIPFSFQSIRRYLLLAGAGLFLDILLKALLAPYWALLLRSYLP